MLAGGGVFTAAFPALQPDMLYLLKDIWKLNATEVMFKIFICLLCLPGIVMV